MLLAANVYKSVGELDEVGIAMAMLCMAPHSGFARLRNGCAKRRTFLNKWGNAACRDLSCTGLTQTSQTHPEVPRLAQVLHSMAKVHIAKNEPAEVQLVLMICIFDIS